MKDIRSTALGVRLTSHPSDAEALQQHGLHRTDPRFGFALKGLKANPARRESIFAQFGYTPPSVPLDGNDGVREADLIPPRDFAAISHLAATLAEGSWAFSAEALRRFLTVADIARVGVTVTLITLLLRRYEATHVESLEHAFLLGLRANPAWRAASRAWLKPVAEPWLAEWLVDKPEFVDLATRARRECFADIPDYMSRACAGARLDIA